MLAAQKVVVSITMICCINKSPQDTFQIKNLRGFPMTDSHQRKYFFL